MIKSKQKIFMKYFLNMEGNLQILFSPKIIEATLLTKILN